MDDTKNQQANSERGVYITGKPAGAKFFAPTKPEVLKYEVVKSPKEMANIAQAVAKNKGFVTNDFMGYDGEGKDKHAKWTSNELTALVGIDQLHLLDQTHKRKDRQQGYLIPVPPKITVSLPKNLDTLIAMLDKRNRRAEIKGEVKEADLEFYFQEYAKIRGYNEEEIGGNILNELKRDLISGGVTSYILEKEKSYLVGSFYTLEIPKTKSKGKWRVFFNAPYRSYILQMEKGYYPILLKAIGDRYISDRKGYLYYFLKEVIKLSGNPKTGFRPPIKVTTLLDNIKISDHTKERPQEAYNVLAECITYLAENYGSILTQVRLLSGDGVVKIINDLTLFKEMNYKRFGDEILADLGVTDIRKIQIAFNPISIENEVKKIEASENAILEGEAFTL